MAITCCYKCPDRRVDDTTNCHTTCEKYLQELEEYRKLKAKEHAEKDKDAEYMNYIKQMQHKKRIPLNDQGK